MQLPLNCWENPQTQSFPRKDSQTQSFPKKDSLQPQRAGVKDPSSPWPPPIMKTTERLQASRLLTPESAAGTFPSGHPARTAEGWRQAVQAWTRTEPYHSRMLDGRGSAQM